MASDRVERRLTAILAADVAGYSRLMGADEEETLARLKAHRRELIDPRIGEHRGRIVKTTGDGLLAEFASVVDAVRGAVEIQDEMAKRNAEVPLDRRIEFRVGINVGDIIIDESDIFGDGVNVAARLEALAEPGGICVSRMVRDQVRDKLALSFEDMGEQQVKNIARPVRAYRVVTDAAMRLAITAAPGRRRRVLRRVIAAGTAALVLLAIGATASWLLYSPHPAPTAADAPPAPRALPDKPSIAVLPFANLSGDPAQDYLADGLTDNLVDALAENPGLFVIARNATLDYRGKAVAPRAVAKDLGVRYVLEGSVQKSGDHIRVTAQLIDTVNDNHLLSQKYDRNLTDLFALEDDLSLQIAGALDVQLRGGTLARGSAHDTRNLEAWENLVKATQAYFRFNPADVGEAQKLAQRAVDLDPNYQAAWQLLAFTYFDQADLGWAQDRIAALNRARRLNDKVLQLDPESASPYWLRARLEMQPDLPEYDPEAALRDARKSVELAPNDDPSHWTLGLVFFLLGHFDEAAAEFATTLRLNPLPYIWESGFHAVTLSATGHYKEAIAEIEGASAAQPKNPFGLSFRGRIEGFAGNYASAARWFEWSREADPASSQSAVFLAQIYDRLGRVDEAINVLENGPPQWRSVPAVRFWLGLSYALAGRKEHAAAEFAAFRALAPKWTLSSTRHFWSRYFTPQFSDRISALSREYGVPEK
ncbi:MAG: tetratricopeptide repeat protein [Alphaproteobacteria bacterium]|nr:tetratricopeptide repeat protein [Alphaproteobacteria bacterium]